MRCREGRRLLLLSLLLLFVLFCFCSCIDEGGRDEERLNLKAFHISILDDGDSGAMATWTWWSRDAARRGQSFINLNRSFLFKKIKNIGHMLFFGTYDESNGPKEASTKLENLYP